MLFYDYIYCYFVYYCHAVSITAVAVEDAGVKEGDEGVLQRAGRAGAGVDARSLGAGGVERGLSLQCRS